MPSLLFFYFFFFYFLLVVGAAVFSSRLRIDPFDALVRLARRRAHRVCRVVQPRHRLVVVETNIGRGQCLCTKSYVCCWLLHRFV